jgi:hypothetical protein
LLLNAAGSRMRRRCLTLLSEGFCGVQW